MVESGGKSLLLPALNLFTVGTLRDSSKWQPRDRRKNNNKLDLISFELFNPYIIGKILEGLRILKRIDKEVPQDQEIADYQGINIRRKKLDHSIQQYEHAIKIFIGNEILKILDSLGDAITFKEIRESLSINEMTISDRWTDMAGMVTPMSVIEDLLTSIKTQKIGTLQDLADNLRKIHNDYNKYSWNWCKKLIRDYYAIEIQDITPEQLIMVIDKWKESLTKQTESILLDAKKEYDDKRRISYGIDGDEKVRDEDFDAVRGLFEENKFIIEVNNEFEKMLSKWNKFTSLIKK
jgi:hypothetical protein